MRRDFGKQVLIQACGTVFGGLVLYGLAALGGVITVHPRQAATAAGAVVAFGAGAFTGYNPRMSIGQRRLMLATANSGVIVLAVGRATGWY